VPTRAGLHDETLEGAPPGGSPPGAGFLGTGLSASALGGVLVVSLALFLFWNGPLWSAPTGASHVGRIAVSYLAVAPMVAAALAVVGRWTLARFLTAVGVEWGVKLVVTSVLYSYLASGQAHTYSPAPVGESQRPGVAARPVVAPAPGIVGVLDGVILERGAAVAGAIVVADAAAGTPPAPREVAFAIRGARYDRAAYLATTADRLSVANFDRALHNLRARTQGRTLWNVPSPPSSGGAPHTIPTPGVGVYEISCDEHPQEHALLVVVDGPRAAVTDDAGRFTLRDLPAGARAIDVYRTTAAATRAVADVQAAAPSYLSVDLSKPRPRPNERGVP